MEAEFHLVDVIDEIKNFEPVNHRFKLHDEKLLKILMTIFLMLMSVDKTQIYIYIFQNNIWVISSWGGSQEKLY